MSPADPAALPEDHEGLNPQELGTFFVFMEAASLLQHQVEQQLRADGDISTVQFQLLAQLMSAPDGMTMTQLADGIVHSRSGVTYQAGQLEKAGLVTRRPSPDDERATLVALTDRGRARFELVLPGHVEVCRRWLLDPLSDDDLRDLGAIMSRVRDHMRAQPPRSAAPRRRRVPDEPPGPEPGPDGR